MKSSVGYSSFYIYRACFKKENHPILCFISFFLITETLTFHGLGGLMQNEQSLNKAEDMIVKYSREKVRISNLLDRIGLKPVCNLVPPAWTQNVFKKPLLMF